MLRPAVVSADMGSARYQVIEFHRLEPMLIGRLRSNDPNFSISAVQQVIVNIIAGKSASEVGFGLELDSLLENCQFVSRLI